MNVEAWDALSIGFVELESVKFVQELNFAE